MHISIDEAFEKLRNSNSFFTELFVHGTLAVEIYKPVAKDLQQPHDRDEVYIVISGTGEFYNDGITCSFAPGDFLFVSAGKEHRFENFTGDFAVWVIFYGPKGGEARG